MTLLPYEIVKNPFSTATNLSINQEFSLGQSKTKRLDKERFKIGHLWFASSVGISSSKNSQLSHLTCILSNPATLLIKT